MPENCFHDHIWVLHEEPGMRTLAWLLDTVRFGCKFTTFPFWINHSLSLVLASRYRKKVFTLYEEAGKKKSGPASSGAHAAARMETQAQLSPWLSLFSDRLQELTGTDWIENKQQPLDELLKIPPKNDRKFFFSMYRRLFVSRVFYSHALPKCVPQRFHWLRRVTQWNQS